MTPDLQPIFAALKATLQKHARGLWVTDDGSGRYCLAARVGPAALRASGGKSGRPLVPVAWIEVRKSYVSYHLMGVYVETKLRGRMSKDLTARMQGKACFNFSSHGQLPLLDELEQLTAQSLDGFEAAGYIRREDASDKETTGSIDRRSR